MAPVPRRRSAPHAEGEAESPAKRERPLAAAGDDIGAAELGRRIAESLKRLRSERRLSLDQLASTSGVSRAALSQIEGARTNPTLAVVWKIAVGLNVPFQALLGGEEGTKTRVLRSGASPALRSPDGRVESRLLSPAGSDQRADVYELRFAPKGVLQSEAHAAGTTETLVVLTGSLRVTVADESHDLAPGDSIFFHADVRHTYESRSSHEARCIDLVAYASRAP